MPDWLSHEQSFLSFEQVVSSLGWGKILLSYKYRMRNSACLYPMSLTDARAIAEQINLSPESCYIEPSRFNGYLSDNEIAAVLLRLRFNAKRWPTTRDDLYLMYVEVRG